MRQLARHPALPCCSGKVHSINAETESTKTHSFSTWHMDHTLQGAKTGEGSSDGDWSVEKLRGCPIRPQDQLLTQGGTYSLSAAVLVYFPVSSSRAVCACR